LVRLILPVVAAIWFLQETLAAACTFYVLSGPLGMLRGRSNTPALIVDQPENE
jgi:hypothetical protein